MTAAVSPTARPTAKIILVTIPGNADSSTTEVTVCHLLAPRGKLISRYISGTDAE